MLLAGILVAFAIAWWVWNRAGEVFRVSIRRGRVLVVRGNVLSAFVQEVKKFAASNPTASGTIVARKGTSHTRLEFRGAIPDGDRQRLRNVFGLYPAAQLRRAAPISKPSLGQILGIAWLAWLLDSSRR